MNLLRRVRSSLTGGRGVAVVGGFVFVAIVVLAFSSVGVAGIPGWWGKGYLDTGPLVDAGRPTLSVLPRLLGGDGVKLGEHPFGQDSVGRDYFARTMRGAQRSIVIAVVVSAVATTLGTIIGLYAGYVRGAPDVVLMRLTDAVLVVPLLVLAAVAGRFVAGAPSIVLGALLGALAWPLLARLVRAQCLVLREREYVIAARSLGASTHRIVFRHLLPNTMDVVIVTATLLVAAALLLESALSFLGVGVQPPDSSLGLLINQHRAAASVRPWLFAWPAVFIVAIAVSIHFIGDGLRDALHPKRAR